MTTIPGTNLGIKLEMEKTQLLSGDNVHETYKISFKYYVML